MLSTLKQMLVVATANLKIKIKLHPRFIATKYFQERLLQRFQDEDLSHLERTIEKAFMNADNGSTIRYTHPAFGCTVVGKKIGLNGFELVTCWQNEEDAE